VPPRHPFTDKNTPVKDRPNTAGGSAGCLPRGCVLENLWLTAESLGIGLQVTSVFSAAQTTAGLLNILSIPGHMEIAYACRLAYPAAAPGRYLRVRRPPERFIRRNACRAQVA